METLKSAHREKFEEDTFPHLKALLSTALWLTVDRPAAENLVLNTMTQAYGSWDDPTDAARSKARLFRHLAREFLDAGTQRNRTARSRFQHCGVTVNIDDCGPQYQSASLCRKELLLLNKISSASIKGSIARLSAQSRLIIPLLFRERFSYADIAYITDLRQSSVKSILTRIRRQIPRYLVQLADQSVTVAKSRDTRRMSIVSSDDGEYAG